MTLRGAARAARGSLSRAAAAPTWLTYAATSDVDAGAVASLPSVDRERAARSTRVARRAQQLAGRVLLRATLETLTGRPGAEHDIGATALGQPACPTGPCISVSHSGDWVACALARGGAVGVDVQAHRFGRRIAEIAHEHFTPEENAWVAAQPERRFYMLWVLKEAYVKALGLGLAAGLRALECRIEAPAIEVVAARAPTAAIALHLYALGDAFVGLASAHGPLGDVAVRRWSSHTPERWLPGRLDLIATTAR